MDRTISEIEQQADQWSGKTQQSVGKGTKTGPSRQPGRKETCSPILAQASELMPWLNRDGQPKSPAELREVVKDWKSGDWERYLASLETPQKEELLGRGEAVEWLSADAHTAALVETVQSAPYPHLSSKVANLLASLSERQRVIVRMRYWENKTLQEIAATLGIRYQSVQDFLKSSHRKIFLRLRIIQAKQQLSKLLNDEQSYEVTREKIHVL